MSIIRTKKGTVQQSEGIPNLGGPTSTHLDSSYIDVNLSDFRDFADRYEELNRGNPQ